jgi:hypothetical protein
MPDGHARCGMLCYTTATCADCSRMNAMNSETRQSLAITRRALVAAGAGRVLGAGGLFLPDARAEAQARGALGGAMGGRHGKDHRGRNKHRKNDKNDDDGQPRDQGLFSKGCSVSFRNQNSVTYTVKCSVADARGISATRDCPRGFSDKILSADDDIQGTIHVPGWPQDLVLLAQNPAIGQPSAALGPAQYIAYQGHSLAEGEGFDYIGWDSTSRFHMERLADSSDYKEFLITALA